MSAFLFRVVLSLVCFPAAVDAGRNLPLALATAPGADLLSMDVTCFADASNRLHYDLVEHRKIISTLHDCQHPSDEQEMVS